MSTNPSAPPPPPHGNSFMHHRWGWGWHDPHAAGAVHPHPAAGYYRYGWYPRGGGRHRLFWFGLGAVTTYWLTRERNCEHRKDFRGWRARYEAEHGAPANENASATAWGPWQSGEWPSSGKTTRSDATDTALEMSEAMLNSISQTVDILRRRLAEKRERSADPNGETQPPKAKLI